MEQTDKPQRIAKLIAARGLCSRREAERWIEQGRVSVDGMVLDSPALQVSEQQDIRVDGKALPKAASAKLWCFHKPKGCITSRKDEQDRPTIYHFLPASMQQLHTVGRLDFNSEGLLLLTNSPELKRRMELPETALQRVYRVRVQGIPTPATCKKLAAGVTVEGIRYKPVIAAPQPGSSGRNSWLEVTLTEGKNREIRRLFEHFGHPVSRLIRTGYGGITLGDLAPGKCQPVPEETVATL